MQMFSSYKPDIENTDVSSIFIEDDEIWVGSHDYINSKCISKLNVKLEFQEPIILNRR